MTSALQPRVNVNILGASIAVANTEQILLIVGQKTPAGSAVAGSLIENIGNNTEDALCGARSQAAAMIRAARAENAVTRFDYLCLEDAGSAVKATATVVFAGAATASGTITVNIGSEDYSFEIPVAIGDTADDVGAALEAAIPLNLNVPVTAVNASGTVTLTAENGGTLGNNIGLSFSQEDSDGITTAITVFTGGSIDPTFTDIFDVVGNNRYYGIVWPYFESTEEVTDFLDGRFNAENKVLDGRAITVSNDTLANHTARLGAKNTQNLVDFCYEITDEADFKGPNQLELLWVIAAQFGSIRALRLTEGASLGQYVIANNGPLDAFGGPALASKPYFNTPFPNLPQILTGRGWNDSEIQDLADVGGSIIGNNISRTAVVAGEVHTTYKTDSAGNPDLSYKYLNYVDTITQVREYFYNNLRAQYSQSRLTTGDLVGSRDMANDLSIRAFCTKLYQDLSGEDFVLLEDGPEALAFFKANLSVTIDKPTGRATVSMVTPIVTQLREILATIKIAFSIEG